MKSLKEKVIIISVLDVTNILFILIMIRSAYIRNANLTSKLFIKKKIKTLLGISFFITIQLFIKYLHYSQF